MSDRGLLSEEELDALRAAGGDGGGSDAGARSRRDGEGAGRPYDFRDPSRVLNGRLPGLEAVHDAFAAGMRKALRGMLGRAPEIEAGETSLTRLGDYQHSLPLPVSVHAAPVQGREHAMFLILDGGLVYACVDAFFGGRGGTAPGAERELSASERRLTALLAGHAFEALRGAWAPICALRFGEPQPAKASGLGGLRDEQILVVSRFQLDLLPGGGELHLAMPYGLLDGLRPHLSAGPRSEELGQRWRASFAERVNRIEVEARCQFPGVRVSFSDLMRLAPGDFIPMARHDRVHVMVGERVLYSAEPGAAEGRAAAKVVAAGESARPPAHPPSWRVET